MLAANSSPVFTVAMQHVVISDDSAGSCRRMKNNTTQVTVPARRPQGLDLHHHARSNTSSNRDVVVYSNVDSGGPVSSPTPGSSGGSDWRGWLIGVIMSFLLPFWRNQLWSLKKIQASVESVVETIEEVVEAVEEVAEKVEEVAEQIEENLPEGELKELLEDVEQAADKAAKAADVAQQVLTKVQAMEDQVESYIDKAPANKNQKTKVN
ncbi:unnamed protein product [Linum trigynum]|uniref:Uncharacterized protein n=1 Tax=Linum trigynum TaxID=586398 RepID=A0AAV2ETI0_9ROSI